MGTGKDETSTELPTMHIDNGDRAGAAILTFCFSFSCCEGCIYDAFLTQLFVITIIHQNIKM